jgi:hypothetical protein
MLPPVRSQLQASFSTRHLQRSVSTDIISVMLMCVRVTLTGREVAATSAAVSRPNSHSPRAAPSVFKFRLGELESQALQHCI